MALITVVAGRYACTYAPPASSTTGASGAGSGPVDVGIMNDNGVQVMHTNHQQEVRDTDAYGGSLLETVYRGSDWRMRMRGKEYKAANINAWWPFGVGAQVLSPVMGVIARRGTDMAGSIVLTSTAGTPAASSPATLTAASVILATGATQDIDFTSRVREVPMEFHLFPYVSGSNNVWFTTT